MDKSASDVAFELERNKKKRKEVSDELQKWASGQGAVYDENGKRISGEPLVSYEDLNVKNG